MKRIFLSFVLVGSFLSLYLAVKSDFSTKKLPIQIMILGGKIVSPEGSKILEHYCTGSGDTLFLDPSYIKNSPVVLEEIKGMREGQTKRVTFEQSKDWRLSYALNPFNIKKEKGKYKVFQYIEFSRKKRVFTRLNFGLFKIKVKDNIVHSYKCTPYVAYCEF